MHDDSKAHLPARTWKQRVIDIPRWYEVSYVVALVGGVIAWAKMNSLLAMLPLGLLAGADAATVVWRVYQDERSAKLAKGLLAAIVPVCAIVATSQANSLVRNAIGADPDVAPLARAFVIWFCTAFYLLVPFAALTLLGGMISFVASQLLSHGGLWFGAVRLFAVGFLLSLALTSLLGDSASEITKLLAFKLDFRPAGECSNLRLDAAHVAIASIPSVEHEVIVARVKGSQLSFARETCERDPLHMQPR